VRLNYFSDHQTKSTVSRQISTRDNLRQKRDTVVTQIAAIDEQWKLIAYKAHTGDSAAETKLIKLNRDRLVLTDDEVTIAVALEARIQEEERLL